MATILQSPKYYFWQKQLLYAQSPNVSFALILQSPNINLAPISWSPNAIFGTYLQNANIILTLVLHILNLRLTGNISIHPSRNTSLTRFIKAHMHHPWQNYSSYRLTKPKQAKLQSPARLGQPTHKSQQVENKWTGQPNSSNNWNSWSPFPSGHNMSNQIKK